MGPGEVGARAGQDIADSEQAGPRRERRPAASGGQGGQTSAPGRT